MAQQNWANLLNFGIPWQTTSGTQLATATTAVISPQSTGSGDFVLPAQANGLQWYPGMAVKIAARGSYSTGGTTSSLTVAIKLGTSGSLTSTGNVLCTTAAIVLGTGSVTSAGWEMLATVACSAIGVSGNTLVSNGSLVMSTVAAPTVTTASTITVRLPNLAVAQNIYTGGQALGLLGTLTAAFGNITCDNFDILQLC